MKRTIYTLIFLAASLAIMASAQCGMTRPQEHHSVLNNWVNPRIGTGGHGHVFYGANVPFGYVQLGPTEPTRGWDWCSGYHDSDSVLIGFGHQHLSGTGIGDLGDIALLPVTSRDQSEVIFSHDDEICSPGYYSVTLRKDGKPYVNVELTATKRTGMHRYVFTANQDTMLLRLELGQGIGWDSPKQVLMEQRSPHRIVGYRFSKGWAVDQKVFFVMDFLQEVILEKLNGDTTCSISAPNLYPVTPLEVKVGLSAVSIENAIKNLEAENPDWSFSQVVGNAASCWAEELGKIQIDTDNEDDRTVFYTALYHTMVAPSVFCDVNGQYRGADGAERTVPQCGEAFSDSVSEERQPRESVPVSLCPETRRHGGGIQPRAGGVRRRHRCGAPHREPVLFCGGEPRVFAGLHQLSASHGAQGARP